jgi:uncharacterized integral membrane protein
MRARLVFVLVAIVLVAGFAAMNWSEFNRPVPLNFGWHVADAPLGMVMLAALAVALLALLLSSAAWHSRRLIETNRHAKALQAQRDLAEKAEASRFTDLRQHLDAQLRENRQREAIAITEFEKAVVQSQRDLRNQLEQINRVLASRLGEIETRIDARLERLHSAPADAVTRESVKL